MVILNAAAGLTVAETAGDLVEGIEKATTSLENGSVIELINSLQEPS